MATKRVGSTGRFGSRYGTRTKKTVAALEKIQKQKQSCPLCERKSLKRAASGIWICKKCGGRIAGGAYLSESTASQIIMKSIAEKSKGLKNASD